MRTTQKIKEYNDLIDSLQERAEEAAEQWLNYRNLIGEAYIENGRKFPMDGYIQDMREENEFIQQSISNDINELQQALVSKVGNSALPEEIGFEDINTEEDVSGYLQDDSDAF